MKCPVCHIEQLETSTRCASCGQKMTRHRNKVANPDLWYKKLPFVGRRSLLNEEKDALSATLRRERLRDRVILGLALTTLTFLVIGFASVPYLASKQDDRHSSLLLWILGGLVFLPGMAGALQETLLGFNRLLQWIMGPCLAVFIYWALDHSLGPEPGLFGIILSGAFGFILIPGGAMWIVRALDALRRHGALAKAFQDAEKGEVLRFEYQVQKYPDREDSHDLLYRLEVLPGSRMIFDGLWDGKSPPLKFLKTMGRAQERYESDYNSLFLTAQDNWAEKLLEETPRAVHLEHGPLPIALIYLCPLIYVFAYWFDPQIHRHLTTQAVQQIVCGFTLWTIFYFYFVYRQMRFVRYGKKTLGVLSFIWDSRASYFCGRYRWEVQYEYEGKKYFNIITGYPGGFIGDPMILLVDPKNPKSFATQGDFFLWWEPIGSAHDSKTSYGKPGNR
jgi:hypothetical protein